MVAILKYENGLVFTGWIAENEEKAKEFLGKKYGYTINNVFYPSYNKYAFKFQEVKIVDSNCVD